MRRSAWNSLYHPYFIDYGNDKLEFFHRLQSQSRGYFIPLNIDYSFFLMSNSFGYDIPHKR